MLTPTQSNEEITAKPQGVTEAGDGSSIIDAYFAPIEQAKEHVMDALEANPAAVAEPFREQGLELFYEAKTMSAKTRREIEALTRDGQARKAQTLFRGLEPRYEAMKRAVDATPGAKQAFRCWRETVNEHAIGYTSLIRREAARDNDAWHVQQEAQQILFERTIECIDRFRPGKGQLRPYVHDSLKLLAIQARQKSRRFSSETDTEPTQLSTGIDGGHEQMIIAQKVVQSVIEKELTDKEKAVFECAFAQGMSTGETAHQLQISNSMVSGYKKRIRKKMSKHLEFEGG